MRTTPILHPSQDAGDHEGPDQANAEFDFASVTRDGSAIWGVPKQTSWIERHTHPEPLLNSVWTVQAKLPIGS